MMGEKFGRAPKTISSGSARAARGGSTRPDERKRKNSVLLESRTVREEKSSVLLESRTVREEKAVCCWSLARCEKKKAVCCWSLARCEKKKQCVVGVSHGARRKSSVLLESRTVREEKAVCCWSLANQCDDVTHKNNRLGERRRGKGREHPTRRTKKSL
jgi:hypothetical protein